jgi:ADP-ribose pyrophosphatase YjhB (NUDIX family)/RimJ/RimL family protein N-acetyltransferase
VTAAADISWSCPSGTFNLRVAAVITRGDQVLLCTVEGLGYWFLPGGRVRFGEPSDAALTRELAEELGHDLPGAKLALVVENIFGRQSVQHEIGFYYRVPWPDALDPGDLHGGSESGHTFRWVPARELGDLDFRPFGLAAILLDPGDTLRHIVLDRLDRAGEARPDTAGPPAALRIVRASPGLVWRALDADNVVGAVRAFLRPDNRWFVAFDTCREDSYAPLLARVTENVDGDLYAIANDQDQQALDRFAGLGFTVNRRESHYLIPTDPLATGLQVSAEPENIVVISVINADEDEIRLLDDALRQDVPGTAGWKWDPGDFREETFDSPQFDPATYLIAVDTESGEYVGLLRIWNTPGKPRLGLIGVVRSYRRRGLATLLLTRAFRTIHQQGKTEVTAEVDDANTASRSLLLRLGARRKAGFVELIKRRRTQ